MFIWKEKKEYSLCIAHDTTTGQLTIAFPSLHAGKPLCFRESSITIDKTLLRVTDSPDKYSQVTVLGGDTDGRDAEIVDITNASINNTVKVQYLDDKQQEEVDLTNLRWRSTHGKKRASEAEPPTAKAQATVGEEVRAWLASIDFDQYAEKIIGSGLDKLKYFLTGDDKELAAHCGGFMKPWHVKELMTAVIKLRQGIAPSESPSLAGAHVALADIRKPDASDNLSMHSGGSQSLPSSVPPALPNTLFYHVNYSKVSMRESMNPCVNPCVNP